MKKIMKKCIFVLMLFLAVSVFATSGEAATWKLSKGKVSNGKLEYRGDYKSFYSCSPNGKNKKIILKLKENDATYSPTPKYLYKNKIVIQCGYMWDTSFGKYQGKTYIYDLNKKKLTKLKHSFDIVGKKEEYLLGCGIFSALFEDSTLKTVTGPIYTYNINTGKWKTLTTSGTDAIVSGNYFYYTSYSNGKLTIYRCTKSGGSRKVLKRIPWKWKLYNVCKFTAHSMTYTVDLDYEKTKTIKY